LGAFEEAGAQLSEFGDERFSFTAGEGGSVDFCGEQDGGGNIGAALETVLFGSAWKFESFGTTTTNATLRNGKLFTALRTA